jgi:hypothetical protein
MLVDEAWCPHIPLWMSRSNALPSSMGMHHWRIPEVLREYNLSSWMRYPLAWRAKHGAWGSPSGIAPSYKYLKSGIRRSGSEPNGLVTTATSDLGSRSWPVGPSRGPRVGIWSWRQTASLRPGPRHRCRVVIVEPEGWLDVVLYKHARQGYPWLDPSRARVSATSLMR